MAAFSYCADFGSTSLLNLLPPLAMFPKSGEVKPLSLLIGAGDKRKERFEVWEDFSVFLFLFRSLLLATNQVLVDQCITLTDAPQNRGSHGIKQRLVGRIE